MTERMNFTSMHVLVPWFRAEGLGLRVEDLGLRVEG